MTHKRSVDALLRLMAWMSPAFPVGAFSYSGGLESAVNDRRLSSALDLRNWISLLLQRGTLWNDAVLFARAWCCHEDLEELAELTQLAQALAGSAERYRETVLLGDAFTDAAAAWPHDVFQSLAKSTPYPVVVGAVASAHGVDLEDALAAYLHSGVSQFVSAGIRLGVAGQKDGVAILAHLESDIASVAQRAAVSTLDDLGSATILADTAAMRHEVQETRLFRS
ncbi:urease accessory protein UreF [Agrobacterium rosae]|uniref:Urease accessory protein UreF n=1 Tax=Agrobacterium rosae TaxID=1972867 RepID=A0AAW9FBA1_9HYPH|nr:urease accessory protein UreF [Agrobacterium rosae]MDX8301722.1 urease accessory protein UreF [Agrobacterium rosae]POO54997.1 urease accessory protein UreF [Agrobacterium rosae]